MKAFAKICSIAALSLAATGCVFIDGEYVGHEDWRDDQRDNRDTISELQIGTQRSVVVNDLGTPADSEAFTHEGEEVRVLFYRTQRRHSDGETTRDETTPVIFKNDMLIGWGGKLYSDLQR